MGLYVGMDLHSTNCYTGILNQEGKKLFGRRLVNNAGKILSALSPYKGEIGGIAVESTYNWYWLVDALMEAGYKVHLANPSAMKQYEGLKYLNDRHDAFWLAKMLHLGILPEGYIYPRNMRGVRDLLRQRSRFVVDKTTLKHTLQQIYCNNTGVILNNNAIPKIDIDALQRDLKNPSLSYQIGDILETIHFLEGKIKGIERHVLQKVKAGEVYPLLTTTPGIGLILGLTITLETGPIDRFSSAGNYASYCRCVPSAYWSNEKKKGIGNKKNGNKYLSWAFAEAANFSIRFCEPAKRFYQRKCAKTNQPSAYRAVANKLAKASYFIMKEKTRFDAELLFRGHKG
ncbi:MAG: IS110 family transposase [Nitrospiria bacterium]